MARRPTVSMAYIERVVKALRKGGMAIASIELRPDGTVVIVPLSADGEPEHSIESPTDELERLIREDPGPARSRRGWVDTLTPRERVTANREWDAAEVAVDRREVEQPPRSRGADPPGSPPGRPFLGSWEARLAKKEAAKTAKALKAAATLAPPGATAGPKSE